MHCTNCSEHISDLAEICPKCGVRPYVTKNFCHSCGSSVNSNQAMCISCGTQLKEIKKTQTVDSTNPAIMGLLSFLLVGLGQMLMGQVSKGIVMLIVSIVLAFLTFGLSSLITTPISIIDAVLIAKKKQQGTQVGEWEFF
ncbi:double zinc ribbon domain-containing protein [Lysinibacillus sp. LZ02]|uniref:zinc ribbon domain-containing protein n=1 Tax=Lysinibacillus sp. LZ02 TaxID=3420668 RepID=UPI003D36B4B4